MNVFGMNVASSSLFNIASAGVAGVFDILKYNEQKKIAEAQKEQLELQQKQNTAQYQQKMLNNFDIMQQTIATQTAQAASRGVGLGSASLGAIQRNTYDVGSRIAKNLEIEKSIYDQNIEIQKKNVDRSLHASLFGDAADFVSKALNIYKF